MKEECRFVRDIDMSETSRIRTMKTMYIYLIICFPLNIHYV